MSTKTIVLTGATRGLGRALSERFLNAGHRVAGCGRSALDLDATKADSPGELSYSVVDVSDASAVDTWARSLIEELGAPDLLINNAALMNQPAPLWQVEAAEFDRMLAVNISGTANVVRAFVPAMIEVGRGVVINFSSGWGRSTSPEVGPYCATKWAIEGFTSSLAQELPPGLAAASLNPGVIDTDMLRKCWDEAAAGFEGPEEWSSRAARFLLELDETCNGKQLTIG